MKQLRGGGLSISCSKIKQLLATGRFSVSTFIRRSQTSDPLCHNADMHHALYVTKRDPAVSYVRCVTCPVCPRSVSNGIPLCHTYLNDEKVINVPLYQGGKLSNPHRVCFEDSPTKGLYDLFLVQ